MGFSIIAARPGTPRASFEFRGCVAAHFGCSRLVCSRSCRISMTASEIPAPASEISVGQTNCWGLPEPWVQRGHEVIVRRHKQQPLSVCRACS